MIAKKKGVLKSNASGYFHQAGLITWLQQANI